MVGGLLYIFILDFLKPKPSLGRLRTEPRPWYRPYYYRYTFRYKLTPLDYENVQERLGFRYIWFRITLSSILQTTMFTSLPLPSHLFSFNKVDYDFYAWWKFFWTKFYVTPRITIN